MPEDVDTLPEATYDSITFLASQICNVPIALVSIVDEDRQWFKSRVGLEVSETHRDLAFCAHAINEPDEIMIVTDASSDERFRANPLVTGDPNIRFYAGAPLVTTGGSALGTLCVIDREPRELTEEQRESLRALSVQVMALLELRRTVRELREQHEALEEASRQREVLMGTVSHELRTPLTALIGFIGLFIVTSVVFVFIYGSMVLGDTVHGPWQHKEQCTAEFAERTDPRGRQIFWIGGGQPGLSFTSEPDALAGSNGALGVLKSLRPQKPGLYPLIPEGNFVWRPHADFSSNTSSWPNGTVMLYLRYDQGSTTAAAQTGPAHAPRPASSRPATRV